MQIWYCNVLLICCTYIYIYIHLYLHPMSASLCAWYQWHPNVARPRRTPDAVPRPLKPGPAAGHWIDSYWRLGTNQPCHILSSWEQHTRSFTCRSFWWIFYWLRFHDNWLDKQRTASKWSGMVCAGKVVFGRSVQSCVGRSGGYSKMP